MVFQKEKKVWSLATKGTNSTLLWKMQWKTSPRKEDAPPLANQRSVEFFSNCVHTVADAYGRCLDTLVTPNFLWVAVAVDPSRTLGKARWTLVGACLVVKMERLAQAARLSLKEGRANPGDGEDESRLFERCSWATSSVCIFCISRLLLLPVTETKSSCTDVQMTTCLLAP